MVYKLIILNVLDKALTLINGYTSISIGNKKEILLKDDN